MTVAELRAVPQAYSAILRLTFPWTLPKPCGWQIVVKSSTPRCELDSLLPTPRLSLGTLDGEGAGAWHQNRAHDDTGCSGNTSTVWGPKTRAKSK